MCNNAYGFETTRQSIVQRVCNGEDGAWEKFWENYKDPVSNYLKARIKAMGLDGDGRYDMVDAESCLGQVHEELCKKLPSYSGDCAFRACIMNCVSQAISDEMVRLNPTGANARRIGLGRTVGQETVGSGDDGCERTVLDAAVEKGSVEGYSPAECDLDAARRDRLEWVYHLGRESLKRAVGSTWRTEDRAKAVRLLFQGVGTGEVAERLNLDSQAVSKTKKALCDRAAEYMRGYVLDDPELGEVCGASDAEFSDYLATILGRGRL